MAAETETPQASETEAAAKPKGKLKPLILVGALMLGEGVGIFALMKVFGEPPHEVVAEPPDEHEMADPLKLGEQAEAKLCEIDAFNRKEGRLYVYHIQLTALVDAKDAETITKFVEVRAASIADRVQAVIRAADPEDLNDPSLETVKRQLLFELNNLLGGKEMIRGVLVSKLLQSRTSL